MLAKLHASLQEGHHIHIQRLLGEDDVTHLGAFAYGDELTFRVTVPRRFGVSAVVLRMAPDGGEQTDTPLTFRGMESGNEIDAGTLSTKLLCKEAGDGLFWYEFLFLRGFDTLFTDSINNVDFALSTQSQSRFRMLVYQKDMTTPAWFRGATMYHIFLDRFCRGSGKAQLRKGATLNEDWEKGIPQYAEVAGEALANDVFFGGNLWGVIEKLDYLQSLGVTVLYLSPLFEAASNHRYDTADYETIDALLGGREAFDALIEAAHGRGMRVILDGVFNHTGDDSRYFNRRGNYPDAGAYQSQESPYASWYSFRRFPDDYEAWWGIEIMPRLQQSREACRRYFTGADGIAAKWIRAGIDGWRLDVADELPDEFLDELNEVVKRETNGEGLLIGEVWENAADKIAYGKRRRYFRGGQLDSVMNYPFRNAVMAFLQDRDAETFCNILTEIYASYPVAVSNSLMNLLGTHDTERIITVLGDGGVGEGKSNAELSRLRLSESDRRRAVELVKLASVLQFTVYGVPSVYYGDEAGLEGYHDPFCRMPFPWGREDAALTAHYTALGALRQRHPCLADGDFHFVYRDAHAFAYERRTKGAEDALLVVANMNDDTPLLFEPPAEYQGVSGVGHDGRISVAPCGYAIFEKKL